MSRRKRIDMSMAIRSVILTAAILILILTYLQWAGATSMQQHKAVWPWAAPPSASSHCQ